jgi:hypothetical protein
MPTFKEELLALQDTLKQEQQKRKELNVLVVQYRPNTVKNTIDPEEVYTRREIARLTKDLARLERENFNMEQYIGYLKNKDKPHVPDVEPPPNPHIPSVDPKNIAPPKSKPIEDPPIP